jgi:hypothetical protein
VAAVAQRVTVRVGGFGGDSSSTVVEEVRGGGGRWTVVRLAVRRGNEAVMAVLKGVEPSGERKRWSPMGKKLTRTRKKLHALPSEKEDRRRGRTLPLSDDPSRDREP